MITDRAAILPLPGDPYLFNLWLQFYDKNWHQYVNRLYVHLNAPIEDSLVKYIADLCASRPNITIKVTPKYTDHGNAINAFLDEIPEKYVMLIEDDAFILNGRMVDAAFSLLESGNYEIVGSKRGSCAGEILEASQIKWGIPTTGMGDQGPNFWPCYFFSSVELLKKTDRNFNARAWRRGETIDGLGYVVDADVIYGDTFVNTSLQLRDLVSPHKIAYVPQYHAHPEDVKHSKTQAEYTPFDGEAPWIHIGSLSSGMSGLLKDADNRPLANRSHLPAGGNTLLENAPKTEMERMEYERRVQIWQTAWQIAPVTTETAEFHALYGQALERVITDFALSRSNIKERQEIYKGLLCL